MYLYYLRRRTATVRSRRDGISRYHAVQEALTRTQTHLRDWQDRVHAEVLHFAGLTCKNALVWIIIIGLIYLFLGLPLSVGFQNGNKMQIPSKHRQKRKEHIPAHAEIEKKGCCQFGFHIETLSQPACRFCSYERWYWKAIYRARYGIEQAKI